MSEGEGRRLVTLVAGPVRGLGALCHQERNRCGLVLETQWRPVTVTGNSQARAVRCGVMLIKSGGVAGTAPPMSKDPGRLELCLFLSRTLRRTQASSRICVSVTYNTITIIITHGKDQRGK